MKKLPLYLDEDKVTAIEASVKRSKNAECDRCPRGAAAREAGHAVCMGPVTSPEPKAGTTERWLFLLGEPTRAESVNNMQWATNATHALRMQIEAMVPDHVQPFFDTAIRCANPGEAADTEGAAVAESCRPYTAQVLDKMKPTRVFCFGGHAIDVVLGRRPNPQSLMGAYAYLSDLETVVNMFPAVDYSFRSKFSKADFMKQLESAMTSSRIRPPHDGFFYVVNNEAEAKEAVDHILAAGCYFSFDLETSGAFRQDHFRLLDACYVPVQPHDGVTKEYAFSFTEESLLDDGVKKQLRRLHSSEGMVPKLQRQVAGHNVQFDLRVIWWWLGLLNEYDHGPVLDTEIYCDTMCVIRILNTNSLKGLDIVGEAVGMGGHKKRAKEALEWADAKIQDFVDTYVTNGRDASRLLTFPMRSRRTMVAACRILGEMVSSSTGKISGGSHNIRMFSFAEIPVPIRMQYCALDTIVTARLVKLLRPYIDPEVSWDDGPWTSYETHDERERCLRQWDLVMQPSILIAAQIETWGLPTRAEPLRRLRKEVDDVVTKCDEFLKTMGFEEKPTDQNLRHWLYEIKEYEVLEYTKTGQPSVSGPTLKLLGQKMKTKKGFVDPILEVLCERAAADKISSSFSTTLAARIGDDDRLYPSLIPTGTDTGRWSSQNPNCFPGETEVLTDAGWVRMDRIESLCGEEHVRIAQYDPQTQTIGFCEPQGFVEQEETFGVHVTGPGVSFVSSHNHRILLDDQNGHVLENQLTEMEPIAQDLTDLESEELGFNEGRIPLAANGSHGGGCVEEGRRIAGCYANRWVLHHIRHSKPFASGSDAVELLPTVFCEGPDTLRGMIQYFVENDIELDPVSFGIVQACGVMCGTPIVGDTEPSYGPRVCEVKDVKANTVLLQDTKMYCVQSELGTLVIRYQGRVFIIYNCQNFPSRGKYAKRVKVAFAPEPDDPKCPEDSLGFTQLDFSNVEYRLAAGISGDPVFTKVFLDGLDPHRATAMLAWDLEGATEEVIKAHRTMAKCYDPRTEILTRSGWVPITGLAHLSPDEYPELLVATEMHDGEAVLEYQKPLAAFTAHHEGDHMLNFSGPGVSCQVTPDHGMIKYGDSLERVTAEDVASGLDIEFRSCGVRHTYQADWLENLPENMRDLSKFQIWSFLSILAAYWVHEATSPHTQFRIGLGAKETFLHVLKHSGLKATVDPRFHSDTEKSRNQRLVKVYPTDTTTALLDSVLDRGELPFWLTEMPLETRRIFLDAVRFWSDEYRENGKTMVARDSASMDVLSALCATSGVPIAVDQKRCPAESFVHLGVPGEHTSTADVEVTKSTQRSQVACVTTQTGVVVTRFRGQTLVCGNTINFGCVSFDSEILTQDGWKTYDEVKVGDRTPGASGWVKILEKVKYDDAPVVDWEGFRVTPNHRWWSWRRTTEKGVRCEKAEFTTLYDVTSDHKIQLSWPLPDQFGDPVDLDESEVALVAWIVTDGSYKNREVSIFQCREKNAHKLDEILHHLNLAGVQFRRYDRKAPSTITELRFKPEDRDRFREYCNAVSPEWVLRLSQDQREAFNEAGLLAEGHKQGTHHETGGRWRFTQKSGRILEAFRVSFHLDGYFIRDNEVRGSGKYANHTARRLSLSKGHITGQRIPKVHELPQGREPVWCVRTEDETWTMRRGDRIALTGNTLYGKQAFSLAADMGITEDEARELIDKIMGTYQRLAAWIKETHRFVAEHGYVFTWISIDGEFLPVVKRNLWDAGHVDERRQRSAARQSVNTQTQGAGAILMVRALWDMLVLILTQPKKYHKVKIRNTVHDSAVLTGPWRILLQVIEDFIAVMEKQQCANVPILADGEVGNCWGDMIDLAELRKVAKMMKEGFSEEEICDQLGICKLKDYVAGKLAKHIDICTKLGLLEKQAA